MYACFGNTVQAPLCIFVYDLERTDPRNELAGYWVSFYFVMQSFATIGFGELWPHNPFSQVLMIVGCVFCGAYTVY